MPEIGGIKRAGEIGKAGEYHKFIWSSCPDCGKERWLRYYLCKGTLPTHRCQACRRRNEKSWRWETRRVKTPDGYVLVALHPDDFFYPMVDSRGYVREHRLVMAKKLGRCLLKGELVHHRPDIARDDNREEVLYLMPDISAHTRLIPCSNCQLKKEIRLLQWRVKELTVTLQLKLKEEV